jgi:hypothetical protein
LEKIDSVTFLFKESGKMIRGKSHHVGENKQRWISNVAVEKSTVK